MTAAAPALRVNGSLADLLGDSLPDNQPVEITCDPLDGAAGVSISVGQEQLGSPTIQFGDRLWRWQWHPRGRAGTFHIRLHVTYEDGASSIYEWMLAIGPSKLLLDQWDRLLADIQRVGQALVYALTGGNAGATDREGSGPAGLLEHYWTRLERQARLAATIVRALDRRHALGVVRVEEERPVAELRAVGYRELAHLAAGTAGVGANEAQSLGARPVAPASLPHSLPVTATRPTTAIYEHRLLLRLLRDLRWRCGFVRQALRQELRWRQQTGAYDAAGTIQGLGEWESRVAAVLGMLDRAAGAPFLEGVSPLDRFNGVTERMRRDRRYRAIARLRRLVDERPFTALHSPAYDLPLADMPLLYERWCVLTVARILVSLGSVVEQRLVERQATEYLGLPGVTWAVRLAEDQRLLRVRRADGADLVLYYQRRYRPLEGREARLGSLDPFLRIPDIAIEVHTPGRQPSVLVLDAKYRLAPDGGIPEEALGDAYTYLAALGYAGSVASRGVYLLFPGDHGFDRGSVGALPFVPGATDTLESLLQQRLNTLSD